jgi:outer membrane protein
VASDNQRVIIAENTLMISKLSLAQLQLDTFQDFDVADNTEVEEDNKILLQTPIAIYDKAKEQRTELKLAQINLEIAEKNVAIAKGAFQPTLRGFYNLSTRVGYADRIVGTELDALNPTSVFGFRGNKPKCFASFFTF